MRSSSSLKVLVIGWCAPVPAWSGVLRKPIIIICSDVWGLYRFAIAAALVAPLAIGLAMLAAPMAPMTLPAPSDPRPVAYGLTWAVVCCKLAYVAAMSEGFRPHCTCCWPPMTVPAVPIAPMRVVLYDCPNRLD